LRQLNLAVLYWFSSFILFYSGVCLYLQSVIVKSVERNALNMYEARKCLLGLESSGVTIASNASTVSCPVGLSCPGLDILSSAGLGLTGLGLLGPTALSVNTSTTPNSLLNALNSSVSPLQSPSSGTPSPALWTTSLANTNATGFSAIPHLMIPSTAQATLTSILLSGVPNYSQNTPSPPPGLTPVEVHVNGMQSESKKGSASLNGHVKTTNIKYAALSAASLGENVLSPNHSDSARQTSTHGASEQVAAKSNGTEGCNDAFVEVGMPRSPSHSANTSDLKQMMSSSKQACAKRQTVELLANANKCKITWYVYISKDALLYFAFLLIILRLFSNCKGFCFCVLSEAVSLVEKLHSGHNSVFSNSVLSDFLFVFLNDLAVGRAHSNVFK
uniref:Protein bicaudal C homolog 1 KH-like domain-containing protein n=1 Tax=Pavo cristatus TaxID=9049 RepID=A0A8C9FL17_PAVCR